MPGVASYRAGARTGAARAAGVSDASIVAALGRGEREPLRVAYLRHGAHIYRLASSLCGPAAAEEVTLAVFLALRDSPALFGPSRGSLRSVLVAEAHRRAVDLLRASPGREALDAGGPADGEARELLASRAGQALARLLRDLSATERQVITLAWSGYTRGQAAALLKLPPTTVNAAIGTGMARLRRG